MPKKWLIYLLVVMQLAIAGAVFAAGNGVPIVCYHDVGGTTNNVYTVTKETLKKHFTYLHDNGYQPISLKQYIAFTKEGAALPEKPVMLTFDDGYISFYNEVFPLLKQYNYPALLAIVGSWMEYAPPDTGKLVSWQQVREMEATGLVTIASHSSHSHRFTPMNPQGDRGQLLATFSYRNDRYETGDEFKTRVSNDLQKAQQTFERELGHKVQALVWPYGEYNMIGVELAQELGFEAMFKLGGGINLANKKGLIEARRGIVMNNPSVSRFAAFLRNGGDDYKPIRAAQIDIDTIYEPGNLRATDDNLNLAISRFIKSGVNTVFLQAFNDEKGTGNIESVYFYTTAAPVKADIFSHIATKLHASGFRVYAWMPSLASQWLLNDNPEDQVVAYEPKNAGWYKRATPFSSVVEKKLVDLFADLGAYAYVDGVLFQDDLYLNDFEDFSLPAKAAFQSRFGRELTPQVLKEEAVQKQWSAMKTEAIHNLTVRLMESVRKYRPNALSARNIYAGPVLDKSAEEWFAQNYKQYLGTYDHTVIMAYPFLEKQGTNSVQWMEKLAEVALSEPGAADKVVFKLQTYDWDKKVWIKDKELKAEIEALRSRGAIHFAYYPEIVFDPNIGKLPQ